MGSGVFKEGCSDVRVAFEGLYDASVNTDIVSTFVLQFIFEGMEESGSDGLDDLVFRLKDTFLKVCGGVLDLFICCPGVTFVVDWV